ncbi:putative GIY-YIG superfamily endonuclease [Sphingobium sp. B7D2B]|nr:putative GIY-YIG superfamily endonuclease [Sphingobium sp. B7D2B]
MTVIMGVLSRISRLCLLESAAVIGAECEPVVALSQYGCKIQPLHVLVSCSDWETFLSPSFPRKRESSSNAAMRPGVDPYVYLQVSPRNGTLYLGVTSNLVQRVAQHRAETLGGFTEQRRVKLLVWCEQRATMEHAIFREEQVQIWRRAWKLDLIEQANPDWEDLAISLGIASLGRLDSRVRGNDGVILDGQLVPRRSALRLGLD